MTREIPRRAFVGAAAAGIAAIWAGTSWWEYRKAGEHVASGAAFELRTFSLTQAADVDAFAAQIMPSEPGSPGAREAHVIHFIDHVLADVTPEARPDFLLQLGQFQALVTESHGSSRFAQLTSAEQQAIITKLEHDKHPFFHTIRVATLYGMFANPEYGGNFNKSGWKLLGFDDRFSWTAPFGYYDKPENIDA